MQQDQNALIHTKNNTTHKKEPPPQELGEADLDSKIKLPD